MSVTLKHLDNLSVWMMNPLLAYLLGFPAVVRETCLELVLLTTWSAAVEMTFVSVTEKDH